MAPVQKTEVMGPPPPLALPRFRVQVSGGFDVGAAAESVDGRLLVGSAQDCGLRLSDPTVSRYHAELEALHDGVVLRDLGSTNGTQLGAASVREVVLRADAELSFGRTRVKVLLGREPVALGVSSSDRFGALLGSSPLMRAVYTALERAAPTSSPVLVTGESGTGKELAAHALHDASPRRDGPFEVVDCGGLPANLIESELFGHERGAFTGAASDRAGAFERAHGGTIFLDELGELPLDLQPKLLRVLAEREVRRLGGTRTRKVDVRVVAATNRDLRREVNAGRFRLDLFYRIAVITVRLPPLRDRLDDLPALTPALIAQIAHERGVADAAPLDDEALAELARHTWPGNVRELRNWLEQLLVLRVPPAIEREGAPDEVARGEGDPRGADVEAVSTALPLKTARERFERAYVATLLAETGGNVTEAARRAGIDRVTMFRTIRRYGLRRDE